LQHLISQQTNGMQLGFLGSPYVNVLQLNEALAKLKT
jgi:K+-transporting ATPase c subunit